LFWSIPILSLGILFPSHFQMHFVHISYPMTFTCYTHLIDLSTLTHCISRKIWIRKLLRQLFTFVIFSKIFRAAFAVLSGSERSGFMHI
jgi:hypothetical protein